MYFLRSLLIPFVCVICLIVAWYLMNETDQRFERERVGRGIELPSSDTSDLTAGDRAQPVSGDRLRSKTSKDPSEAAETNDSSNNDTPPGSEKGKSQSVPIAMHPATQHDSSGPKPSVSSERRVGLPKTESKSDLPRGTSIAAQSLKSRNAENRSAADRKLADAGTLPIHVLAKSGSGSGPTVENNTSNAVDASEPADAETQSRMLNRASQSTVRFERKDGSMLGCGVIVATSVHGFDVLTANHLFAETESFSITTFDRDSLTGVFSVRNHESARIIKRSVAMDLALVHVKSVIVPLNTASLADLPSTNSMTELSGWAVFCDGKLDPASIKISRAEKTTARRSKESESIEYWKIGKESVRGASGSGLFDDKGQLVGIASGNSRGFAYYCHANGIAKFLKE